MGGRAVFVGVVGVTVAIASGCLSRPATSPPRAPGTTAGPTAESCAHGQPRQCRKDADARKNAGDLAGAFALQTRACDLGDHDACFDVAIATHDGSGRPADVALGRKLFSDSCQRGHALACATLAALLRQTHEDTRALELRERACGLGHQPACNDIGVDLVDATDEKRRDPARARQLFERACDAAVAAACTNLALAFPVPEGDRDAEGRIVALLARACEGKNPAGCREMGVRHVNGQGLPRDEVAAAAELAIACSGDDALGCDWLGYTQENGLGRPTDTQQSVQSYGKACDKGAFGGCYHLGRAYAAGRGIEKDDKHACELYVSACSGGLAEGCSALWSHATADDVCHGESRLEELCKKDIPAACGSLGRRLVWKPQSAARGLELLRAACEKDHADACEQGLYSADTPRKGMKRNAQTVFFFAERACRANRRCGKLAELLMRGNGTTADAKRASDVAQAACAKEDGEGCLVAAQGYRNGKGVARDPKRAAEFFERGCEHDSAEACDGLARALRTGDGVARNLGRAKEIEQKARDIRED